MKERRVFKMKILPFVKKQQQQRKTIKISVQNHKILWGVFFSNNSPLSAVS